MEFSYLHHIKLLRSKENAGSNFKTETLPSAKKETVLRRFGRLADEKEDHVEHTLRYLRLGLLLPINSQGQRENAHTEIAGT
jgi:hypothetical protein